MGSKSKTTKRTRKKKRFTIKALDEQNNLGFIETLYNNGEYADLLIFLLETMDTTVIRVNPVKGCIELYLNEENTKALEETNNRTLLSDFEKRINRINHNLTLKQQKVLKTYKELNSEDPYNDLEDEDYEL